ncbi:MAG: UDP-4-amino-4,6-dideoxy-N-acetyl-beta-L-altrosamine transaminase [Desulfobacterium sp.]|nr:UDP-4-amino-4,6-dideoxy-N-acetyl-beta-L-altrosamine transaminase [Desulfobacterium sp.]
MNVEFFRHNLNETDIDNVTNVLKSIFLTTGDVTKAFEDELSRYVKAMNAIGVTSCTAALHLCLLAWGIGQGDEVITTPMSFCATSNSILHAGAKPVFVDVEADTGNIDADLIEEKITSKTKAIIPVHLYGQMCDMKKIHQVADKHGLIVIEDAAHCIEGERDGIRVGQLGDAACYSFYATKNITSGEGGAITTNDRARAEHIRMLRLHGIDKSAVDRYTKKYKHWDMPLLGWKYNMDNIHAALLVDQIKRIDDLWKKRDAIWRNYEEKLAGLEGVKILKSSPNLKHARHLFTILVMPEKRDAILWALQDKGIGVAVNYRAIHLLKYYQEALKYREGEFPCAEKIGASTISLPLYPSLTNKEVDYVVCNVPCILTSLGA